MGARVSWAPITDPRWVEDILIAINDTLHDANCGMACEMAESIRIETRGERETITFRTDRNYFRIHLHPDAAPVESPRLGRPAWRREIQPAEILAVEHIPLGTRQ